MGISYGITAVDGQAPILDEQASARISSGLRTVGYYCPNESQPAGGASLSFNFQAGQAYELVCRAAQHAEIRVLEGCGGSAWTTPVPRMTSTTMRIVRYRPENEVRLIYPLILASVGA